MIANSHQGVQAVGLKQIGSREGVRVGVELPRSDRPWGQPEPMGELVEPLPAEPWLVPAEVQWLEPRYENSGGVEAQLGHIRRTEVPIQ